MLSFTPEVSSFDKEKGFWGCRQGFWLTVYCLRPAAQLYRNMEKGNRSVLSAAAFLFQGETCNIPTTVNREKGVGVKLRSKLFKNYCLLLLKLLTGDPQIVGLSERKETTCFQKEQFEQIIWRKRWKDTATVMGTSCCTSCGRWEFCWVCALQVTSAFT